MHPETPTPTTAITIIPKPRKRLSGTALTAVLLLASVAVVAIMSLTSTPLSPLEQYTAKEQTAYDAAVQEYRATERALVFRKIEWYITKLSSGEALTPTEAADYERLQQRAKQVESSLIPTAHAAGEWQFSDDAALNLDQFFRDRGSPLAGHSAEILWAAETHGIKDTAFWIGKMQGESHYCTHFAKPAVEQAYHNCGGLKIRGADADAYWAAHPELIKTLHPRTGKPILPDANGSYLRMFDDYGLYFAESARLWAESYNHLTPAQVQQKWVGNGNGNWLKTAQYQASLIRPLITPTSTP